MIFGCTCKIFQKFLSFTFEIGDKIDFQLEVSALPQRIFFPERGATSHGGSFSGGGFGVSNLKVTPGIGTKIQSEFAGGFPNIDYRQQR